MDFVVLGFGLGALAVLIGLGLRDLGPMLRRVPRSDGEDVGWEEVARRVAWGRTCRAAGLIVSIAGALLCLVTFVALVAGVGDGAGMGSVLGATGLAVAGAAIWALLFMQRARNGEQVVRVGPGNATAVSRRRASSAGRGERGRRTERAATQRGGMRPRESGEPPRQAAPRSEAPERRRPLADAPTLTRPPVPRDPYLGEDNVEPAPRRVERSR